MGNSCKTTETKDKKPNDEPVLETNDKSNDIIKDKDDYPHDSDPAFRKRRKLNSNYLRINY